MRFYSEELRHQWRYQCVESSVTKPVRRSEYRQGPWFPRYLQPPLVRIVGNLFPLTYFVPIARGIVTKGVSVPDLWEQVVALAVYVVAVMFLSIRAFRQDLE